MTHAKLRILAEMAVWRVAHGILGRDRIEVLEPSDPAWPQWIASIQGMDGDPETAFLAVRAGIYGVYYSSVDEALHMLPAWFNDASIYPPDLPDIWN